MSEAMTMPPLAEATTNRAPTVYFIDDSSTMREVIKIAFRREKFNVITCGDAASAMAQFEQNRPDVVITDVIMPDQDGYSVCSQIKQHPEFGEVPVILMSGVVNKGVADKAVAVKADELIRKPFQPQELISRVKSLLAPKGAAAPAPEPAGSPTPIADRAGAHALHSLFAPPRLSPTPVPSPIAPLSANANQVAPEHAWPQALAQAFSPLLPPFSTGAPSSARNQESQPPPRVTAPTSMTATITDVAKLRGELARVEMLVKKLQSELQLEREYNQALEKQIRDLLSN
jgi:CheY-like chemotaxis protein